MSNRISIGCLLVLSLFSTAEVRAAGPGLAYDGGSMSMPITLSC